MSAGKRARPSGGARSWKGFLIFLAVLAALVLVSPVAGPWINRLVSGSGPDVDAAPPAATDTATDGSASPSPAGSGDPSDPVERCAQEVAAVEAVVEAARAGVDHWRAHVQARTDMLAGRISEEEMEAVYDRTRAEGHADHERFSAAASELGSERPCQDLEGQAGAPARDCLARAQQAESALAAARSTMDEWLTHLHHMEEYADGGMRSGKALKLWVKAWRTAPEGISAYDDRAADLQASPACSSG